MDRRSFLIHACGIGACGCAMGLAAAPAALRAEGDAAPDQRLFFARYQVANLMRFMEADPANAAACAGLVEKVGRECARLGQLQVKHKGDLEGYLAAIQQAWGTESTYDKAAGVVTVVVPEGECACPLVDGKRTPAFWCNCSVGYQKEAFETITGRPVMVSLKESKLSGSARCVFEIRLG
jgi:predicted hydrocarbon binding protein